MHLNQKKKTFWIKIFNVLLPIILIAAGGAAWAYFKATAPRIERAEPKRQPAFVEVRPVHRQEARISVSAMGTVVPSREVTLKARVSGEVKSVASRFVPGGRIEKGGELLRLDPSDHQVSVSKAKSALENAKAALEIEQGNQTIAREELRLLSEASAETIADTDLALRKPQLQQARAAVASAEADLRMALLDLERTRVCAPFNALIVERHVNIGATVGVQGSLATIVGTDEFWAEAVVPVDQLSFLDMNRDGGCPAEIRSQAGGGRWQGKVVRIAGKLNETSRMATVIVAITDPLSLTSENPLPSLMIDDYVFVEIAGCVLSDVIELPRQALHDGDTVWVCKDGMLDVRPVTLSWKGADAVYIQSGLSAGEQVVISELSSPLPGMPLQVVDIEPAENQEAVGREGTV